MSDGTVSILVDVIGPRADVDAQAGGRAGHGVKWDLVLPVKAMHEIKRMTMAPAPQPPDAGCNVTWVVVIVKAMSVCCVCAMYRGISCYCHRLIVCYPSSDLPTNQ